MANFTQTATATVRVFGSPSDQWNVFKWGAFKWGDGTASLAKKIVHYPDKTKLTITPTIAQHHSFTHVKNESISFVNSMAAETLQEPNGYYYLFPDQVTNGELRTFISWSTAAAGTSTWVTQVAGSTTWS